MEQVHVYVSDLSKKVKVGKDQEMEKSEILTPKTEVAKTKLTRTPRGRYRTCIGQNK